MKRTPFVAAGTVILLMAAVVSANAAPVTDTFNFTGSSYYDASGQFTYDSATGLVQSITGTVTSLGPVTAGFDGPIGNLILTPGPFTPPGSLGASFTYDNIFDPVSGTFTGQGILFSFGTGNYGEIYDVNLTDAIAGIGFSAFLPDGNAIVNLPDGGQAFGGPVFFPGDSGSLIVGVAAIPELSTWMMMILGFIGMGVVMHRKRKIGTVVAAA
jgi:hypothetical protein